MKKFIIFIIIVFALVCVIAYMYFNYKVNYNIYKKANFEFENYLDKEIYGAELSTLINKAINNNEISQVDKNAKGIYQDNGKDSISIQIKMMDKDLVYNMESFYNSGMHNFVNYYNNIKFKCVEIQYHDDTHRVKYMLFKQITS